MSDNLLREAEFEQDDPADIDVSTLDEIVDRVRTSYQANAEKRIREIEDEFEAKLAQVTARAETAEIGAAELERQRSLRLEERARAWSRTVTQGIRWAVGLVVVTGATCLLVGHPFHGGWFGALLGSAVAVFVLLELMGILGHLSGWAAVLEVRLTRRFRQWLAGEHDTVNPAKLLDI